MSHFLFNIMGAAAVRLVTLVAEDQALVNRAVKVADNTLTVLSKTLRAKRAVQGHLEIAQSYKPAKAARVAPHDGNPLVGYPEPSVRLHNRTDAYPSRNSRASLCRRLLELIQTLLFLARNRVW